MGKYLLKRIGTASLILLLVSIIIFALIHNQPGNPFTGMVAPDTDPAFIEARMEAMGYNDPIPLQYIKWLGRLFQGDLGYSIQYKKPVGELISERLGNTLILSGTAFILNSVLAILLGIFAAAKKNKWQDTLITILAFLGISLPTFFMALLFIKYFSFQWGLLPPTGMVTPGLKSGTFPYFIDLVRHLIMPVLVLTITQAAILQRYVRGSMVDALSQDYIRTARGKGLSYRRTVFTHGFRNTLVPVITVLCTQFPNLLSGAVITETVFVWPGIGRLNYDAILAQDYPLIMGITIVMAIIVIFMNLLGDILCAWADPKLRIKGRGGE